MFLVRRYPQWMPIILAGTLYGVAFVLPAADLGVTLENQPTRPLPISGQGAFRWAFTFRAAVWLANPLLWIAAFFLAWRLWPWAAALGIAATGFALWTVIRNVTDQNESSYKVGYWLWVGSMALLSTTALLGWMRFVPRDQRRSLVEVFAGWRGATIGSWLVTGLAVLGVSWFWNDLEGGGNRSNPANEEVVSDVRTVAGVTFTLERKGHGSGYNSSQNNQFLRYEVGTHKLEFNDGELTLDGIDRGDLKAGDTVRLTVDGTLFVNGNLTDLNPLRPKRVDPPTIPLSTGEAGVLALAWTSAPTRLIALTDDQKIRGWELANPKPTFTLTAPENLGLLAVSPSGKRIAAASPRGKTVFLWNSVEEPPTKITGAASGLSGIAFLDNEYLIEARGKETSIRRIGKDDEQPIPLGPGVYHFGRSLAVSGDGHSLARLRENETLALLRLSSPEGIPTPVPGLTLEGFGTDSAPVLNRDGTRLFAHRDGSLQPNVKRGLFVLDTLNGAQTARLRWRHVPGFAVQIQSAAFSPDNSLLAVGEVESVRVFDVASGRERAWFGSTQRTDVTDNRPREMGWCNAVAFSPDGKYLAAGFRDGKSPKLRVWETDTFLNAGEMTRGAQ